jgi:hypothetical protein
MVENENPNSGRKIAMLSRSIKRSDEVRPRYLTTARDPGAANKFVAYLLKSNGQSLQKEHGLTLQKMDVSGDARALPQDIKAIVGHIM